MSFFFYSVMSVCVYIAYVWLSNYMSFSLVRYSVVELNESPLFWLCIFLIGGACFCFDLAFELLRFTYEKTGSDFIREFISAKKINKDYNLN
jgi:hypothetical protein